MIPVISLDMIYPGYDTSVKIEKVYAAGFRHVEFAGWREKDIRAVRSICLSKSVQVVNISGHRRGSIVSRDEHDLFYSDIQDTVKKARFLQTQYMMFLTNAVENDGRVSHSYIDLPYEEKFNNTVLALKKAVRMLPDEMKMVLEPLNTITDHKGYFLTDPADAVRIIRAVDSPRCSMLCDLYHFGVMGFDLQQLIEEYAPFIGYVHIADFPGRHEIPEDSIYWMNILSALESKGYDGYVGFEYVPENDSSRSIEHIAGFWKNFSATLKNKSKNHT